MPKANGRSPLWWNQNSPTTVQLFDLVVSGGVVGERHWNSDGFLAEILKRHLQLLTRSQSCQQVGGDRSACIAASRFAGLDLHVENLALIYLELCAARKIESKRQLHQCDGRMRVARHTNVDQHDQLSGLAEHGRLLYRAFERTVALCAAAACRPAGRRCR